jgi:hypothetical protein
MTDMEFVKLHSPNACEGYHMVQYDGIYHAIMGIPGFRMISYLGNQTAWKAARVFIETGVQWACGSKVHQTSS